MTITWQLKQLTEGQGYTIKKDEDASFERSFTATKSTQTISFNDDLVDIITTYQCNGKSFTQQAEFTPTIELINKNNQHLLCEYNPELTSFKYNYVDTVTPTLGSAYPVIRRNGTQKYRSFSLGGLIAAEENVDFNISIPNSLTDEYTKVAYRERVFREQVLQFLHSPEPLLCKTGPEGMMIIRLTNVSLTSNKQLDRNIYSFTATATEVMECTDANWRAIRGNGYVDVSVS